MVVLDNPEKKNFFAVFRFFFRAQKRDFQLFANIRHPGFRMPYIRKKLKITFLGSKEKSQNRKKKFFFRIGQNYPKVTKKVKNSKSRPVLLRLELIFGHFLRWPKSPNLPFLDVIFANLVILAISKNDRKWALNGTKLVRILSF